VDKCPAPIETVSPSPVTPRASKSLFPGCSRRHEGMRPWTELKPMRPVHKVSRTLRRQPMPLNFATRSGRTPISYIAFDDAFGNLRYAAPGTQRSSFPPRYQRLATDAISLWVERERTRRACYGSIPHLLYPHHHKLVSYRSAHQWKFHGYDRSTETRRLFGLMSSFSRVHLPVRFFRSTTYSARATNEVVNLARKRIRSTRR